MKQGCAEGIINQQSEADGVTLSRLFTIPHAFISKVLAANARKRTVTLASHGNKPDLFLLRIPADLRCNLRPVLQGAVTNRDPKLKVAYCRCKSHQSELKDICSDNGTPITASWGISSSRNITIMTTITHSECSLRSILPLDVLTGLTAKSLKYSVDPGKIYVTPFFSEQVRLQ